MFKTTLLSCLATAALVVACSSSDSSTGSGTSSGSSAVNKCGSSQSSSSSTSKCTQAELDAYSSCPVEKCDAEYQACLGSSYKTGNFAGACKSYFDCNNACACNDTACAQKCAQSISGDCSTCMTQKIAPCTQSKCPIPSCMTGGTTTPGSDAGVSATACTDLEACCNSLTGTDKDTCTSLASSAKAGGAAGCSAVLSSYKAQSKCK